MSSLRELIYSPEKASGEAISKVESHTPKIEVPEEVKAGEPFTVKISVGPHPNKVEHSIRWIELYFAEDGRTFNPVMISRVFFSPEYAEPEVVLKISVKKAGTLIALGYCNLHGLWEGSKYIKVTQ